MTQEQAPKEHAHWPASQDMANLQAQTHHVTSVCLLLLDAATEFTSLGIGVSQNPIGLHRHVLKRNSFAVKYRRMYALPQIDVKQHPPIRFAPPSSCKLSDALAPINLCVECEYLLNT